MFPFSFSRENINLETKGHFHLPNLSGFKNLTFAILLP